MNGGTVTWTIATAVAALMAAPVAGYAETRQTSSAAASAQAAEVRQTEAEHRKLAHEHLGKASAVLGEIPTDAQPAEAQARIADVKQRINALQRTADESERAADPADRETELAAIERALTELLGPEGASRSATEPGDAPVGTSGAPAVLLDEPTKTKLQQVRTHITAYTAAMGSAELANESAAAAEPVERTADPSTAPAPPSAADATASTSPTDPTPTPTGTSPTDTPQTPAAPDRTERADAAPRERVSRTGTEAARPHLSAARNTLSEMTQLPAAAAITGEARAQISQLITQFNELIAADPSWQVPLERVKSTLNGLLGTHVEKVTTTDVQADEPVGTTGAMTLEPEIRAKLFDFRTHLEAFERTAESGRASRDGAEPLDPPSTTAAEPVGAAEPGTVATRVSETDPTAASGSTSTGSPVAEMPGRTAEGSGAAATTAGDAADDATTGGALRHIEAIEAILVRHASAQAEEGTGATAAQPDATAPASAAATSALDAAQVAEIRKHLNELRRLVDSRAR
jgi:hypothetical protein